MIRANTLQPELSHVIESGEFPVFVTCENRVGCLFELPLLDLESREAESLFSAVHRIIESAPDDAVIRLVQSASESNDVGYDSFRTDAINRIGFVKRRILLSIESSAGDPVSLRSLYFKLRGRRGNIEVAANRLINGLPRNELAALNARALSRDEIEREFQLPQAEVSLHGNAIDLGDRLTGVLRIYKPGTRTINDATLAGLLDQLPMPYRVCANVKKVPKHRADFRLRSQLAKNEVIRDSLSAAKQEATEKALNETAMYGASLCELEWLLVMDRPREQDLRLDLEKAKGILSTFGEVMIESIGCVPSFVASHFGAMPHFLFLEDNHVVPYYLPAFGFGESRDRGKEQPARTMLLHRLDGSLHSYDHFNKGFLAYNALICGKTGSGKSVLANALSSALMQDPCVRMIKIDVGGSYKKECEVFGGSEVSFELDSPSGVNPFSVLGEVAKANEAIDMVAEFLATLIREEDENQVPKAIRARVEDCLKKYVAALAPNSGIKPSIDHFLSQTDSFPRKSLLMRWATGGVFENALKERPQDAGIESQRYRYFNFENIQAAANRDFVEGVMAAVITMVNLEMLRLGDRSKGQNGDRLVLFCDETKFFIDRFSQFFLLTAANFRKFGHGVVLMLQNIRNAEIRLGDGSVDRGLILNSPIRFFLQADTEADYLTSQFQFDSQHLRVVVTHPYRGREYREAVLQDDNGTRVLRLYLTDDEYWRMTSTREDVDKFNRLRNAIPGLTVEEAIRCLAVSSGR